MIGKSSNTSKSDLDFLRERALRNRRRQRKSNQGKDLEQFRKMVPKPKLKKKDDE